MAFPLLPVFLSKLPAMRSTPREQQRLESGMSWREGAPKAHPNNIPGTARGNGAKGSSGRLAGVPAEGEDGSKVEQNALQSFVSSAVFT